MRRSSSDGLNKTVPLVKMTPAHGEEHKLWSQPSKDKSGLLWTLTGFRYDVSFLLIMGF